VTDEGPLVPESLENRWGVVDERIRAWWDGDTHRAGEKEIAADSEGTLLYLPHPYISAGGSEAAFPEMYCWDTFFINQGLLAHGRFDRVRDHVLNQLFLVARHGFVPNGNRKFYLTRSQVPLLGESVRRYLEATEDQETIAAAFPLLMREYLDFWCAPPRLTPDGLSTCADSGDPARRAELAAEAETGLDFTAIYDGDVRRCAPLHVNCALVLYARAIARIALELGREEEARRYSAEADYRAGRVRELCWDDEAGFFFEYDHVRRKRLPFWSLCAYWTLWARVATEDQARRLVGHLARFERPHGLPFTPEVYPSPHPEYSWVQWGFPSGWPPMQMVVVEGLDAYGFTTEAKRIAEKFVTLQVRIFEKTGRLWEKYNVLDGSLDLPRERYELPAVHGWSSSSLVVLGRHAFLGSYGT
jgi:alpha,alpha-trehalase